MLCRVQGQGAYHHHHPLKQMQLLLSSRNDSLQESIYQNIFLNFVISSLDCNQFDTKVYTIPLRAFHQSEMHWHSGTLRAKFYTKENSKIKASTKVHMQNVQLWRNISNDQKCSESAEQLLTSPLYICIAVLLVGGVRAEHSSPLPASELVKYLA